jgi:L-lysine 2,3-aminomutase
MLATSVPIRVQVQLIFLLSMLRNMQFPQSLRVLEKLPILAPHHVFDMLLHDLMAGRVSKLICFR